MIEIICITIGIIGVRGAWAILVYYSEKLEEINRISPGELMQDRYKTEIL